MTNTLKYTSPSTQTIKNKMLQTSKAYPAYMKIFDSVTACTAQQIDITVVY